MRHEDDIVRELGEARGDARRAHDVRARPRRRSSRSRSSCPRDAVPSLLAAHNQLRWTLKGICDRKLRGDNTVSAELVVYNAPG